jgi:hypothetical protein
VTIKPKKVTVQQLNTIDKLSRLYDKDQLRKRLGDLNFQILPTNKLSFSKAQKVIDALLLT